ncbi:hypothetical protein GL263_07610 [Streptomyces durbertensis]|uniref:Secreted protein n=1 Tax=Streptomyces durbertensis TaxID=2448886 RepID=A0ABR6EDU9_9ACTN|nr:hypothetical protein [Streptomyces durbertensis]MBB1243428.1 hypothetical protein [Streptomyces durbertensis]
MKIKKFSQVIAATGVALALAFHLGHTAVTDSADKPTTGTVVAKGPGDGTNGEIDWP